MQKAPISVLPGTVGVGRCMTFKFYMRVEATLPRRFTYVCMNVGEMSRCKFRQWSPSFLLPPPVHLSKMQASSDF